MIDIQRLRDLLAEWNQPMPKGDAAKGWEWKQRVKHGELASEAVRALPQLLAIAEAAGALRDMLTDLPCEIRKVETLKPLIRNLHAAVDAARKERM